MVLENKLGITESSELARVEEKLSKKKALELFVFKDDIPYELMRQELIKSLENDKTVLYLYRVLKGM